MARVLGVSRDSLHEDSIDLVAELDIAEEDSGAATKANSYSTSRKKGWGRKLTSPMEEAEPPSPTYPNARASISQTMWAKLRTEVGTLSIAPNSRRTTSLMLLNQGLPIRETMKALYSVRRLKYVWELGVLLTMLILFSYICITTTDRRWASEQEFAITELLIDEEFPGAQYKKNFYDIRSEAEFWTWAEGPLLSGLYPAELGNGDAIPVPQQDYVSSYLRVVGGVQLRQFRVSNASCVSRRGEEDWQDRIDTKDQTCFDTFFLGRLKGGEETRQPFGPGGMYKQSTPHDKHARVLGHYAHGMTFFADEVEYGSSGYPIWIPPASTLLPLNRSASISPADIIQSLKQNGFVDRSTRGIVTEVNFFNTNTGLLTAAQLLVEFFPSGLIEASARFRHCRIPLYASARDGLRIGCEIFYIVVLLYQLQREVKRILFTRPLSRCLCDASNILNMVFFMLSFAFLIGWYRYAFSQVRLNFDVNAEDFVNYYDMADQLYAAYKIGGVVALIASGRIFRYLSLNRRMSILWQAIESSLPDLGGFFAAFLVLLAGFSFCAYMFYGSHRQNFNTLYWSLATMFRFWVSDYEYNDLVEITPNEAFFFFLVWSVLVYLLILNMFIAITTDAFTSIQEQTRNEKWKHDLPSLWYEMYKRRTLKLFILKRRCIVSCTEDVQGNALIRCCKRSRTCFRRMCGRTTDSQRSQWSLEGLGVKASTPETSTYHVWSRELQFFDAIARAARRARRMTMSAGRIDLFEYFLAAYKEQGIEVTSFMTIDELCTITMPRSLMGFDGGDAKRCTHENCYARQIIDVYASFKSVLVLGGQRRESSNTRSHHDIANMEREFRVVKINNVGLRQLRIMMVDEERSELRSFDKKYRLRQILPLRELQQIENSEADDTMLCLTFKEGIYTYCALEFQDMRERERFIKCIIRAQRQREKEAVSTISKDNEERDILRNLAILLLAQHQKGVDSNRPKLRVSDVDMAVKRLTDWLAPSNKEKRKSRRAKTSMSLGSLVRGVMRRSSQANSAKSSGPVAKGSESNSSSTTNPLEVALEMAVLNSSPSQVQHTTVSPSTQYYSKPAPRRPSRISTLSSGSSRPSATL